MLRFEMASLYQPPGFNFEQTAGTKHPETPWDLDMEAGRKD